MGFLTKLGTSKYWIAGMVFLAIASFGVGYRQATVQAESILADKVLEAYAAGTAAQKRFDDAQRRKADADKAVRDAANVKRDDVLAAIIVKAPELVPHNDACTLSVEAIKALNEVAK